MSVREALKNRWFWRVAIVSIFLGVLPHIVNRILTWAFSERGIQTWQDFGAMWMKAHQSGLLCTVPSLRVAVEMTSSTVFMLFITYVFLGISSLGIAVVALKATRNDAQKWFSDSLVGFRRPLELLWFLAVTNLWVTLWTLLLFIPGLIAVYRYRNGWYLKSEHPDWSVSRCLTESGRMMCGYKWRAFRLDCYYFIWLFIAMSIWVALGVVSTVFGFFLLKLLASVAALFAMLFVLKQMVSLLIARAEFYQELKIECSSNS